MGYIELAPSDREKFGAPERIEFEYNQIGLRTIAALKSEVGHTLETLASAIDDKGGNEEALAAVVWMVLRSAGIRVPWAEFDVVPKGLTVNFKSADDDPGKDQTPQSQTDSGDPTDPLPSN
jgi:hypothetical protein